MIIRRESITDINFDRNLNKNNCFFINKSHLKLNNQQVDDDFNNFNDYDLRSFPNRYASQFSFYFRYIFYQY